MPEPKSQYPDLPETFDLEELKGVFSAEEIAELAAGDDPIVTLDPEAPKPDDDASLADDDAAALAAAEAAEAAAKAAQQAAAAAPKPEAQQEAPVEIPDTSEADAIITSFDQKFDDLQTKYDEGDLTRAEFNSQVKALSDDLADAKAVVNRATELIQTEQAKASQRWDDSLKAFKAAGNELLWSQEHVGGFDSWLKAVTGNPDNATMSFDAMIRLAARQYQVAYEAKTGQTIPLAGQAPKADPTPKPQQQRPDAPQLLGGLNGDGGLSVDDGTFAAIDRQMESDPLAAEKMIARLPAATRDAYLRGA